MAKQKTKRYNLVLTEQMFTDIQTVAEEEGVTFLEAIRGFIKLGLFVDKQVKAGAEVFVRDGNGNEKMLLIL